MERHRVVILVAAALFGCGRIAPESHPPTVVAAGTSGDYPPLSEWHRGRAEGYAIDVFERFALVENIAPRYTRFRWPELALDRFEIAVDGITVRPERSIAGRFTVPIAYGGAVLLLRRPAWAERADIQKLDRPELTIAVNRGGHLERVTRDLFHSARIGPIDGNAVRERLARGEVDAVMTNTFEAPRWEKGLEGVERIGPLTSDVTAFWVRADDTELAERLDEWLLDAEDVGTLAALRARWFEGVDAAYGPGWEQRARSHELPSSAAVLALLAATQERLALMPYVAGAKNRDRRPLEDPAQEAKVVESAIAAAQRAARKWHKPLPAPSRVEALFRVEIDAAKEMQRDHVLASNWSLAKDLRPAIARIGEKIAFLLVHVPPATKVEDVRAVTPKLVPDLPAPLVDRLAGAIAAFGE